MVFAFEYDPRCRVDGPAKFSATLKVQQQPLYDSEVIELSKLVRHVNVFKKISGYWYLVLDQKWYDSPSTMELAILGLPHNKPARKRRKAKK